MQLGQQDVISSSFDNCEHQYADGYTSQTNHLPGPRRKLPQRIEGIHNALREQSQYQAFQHRDQS